LEQYVAALSNPILDSPDKDFLVTSLDLLSAIIQAVDEKQSAALVSGSQPQLFELLTFCMDDPENEVRQSSYALLGDCAKYVFPQLKPFLPKILPVLIQQLDLNSIIDEQMETGFSVLNNACWSVGEIAINKDAELGPYVDQLLERFLEIKGNPEVPKSVTENAAIALGRLGLWNAELLSPHLATIAEPFLKSMGHQNYTQEKATAFKGFLQIVMLNPQAMERDIARLLTAIAKYKESLELKACPLTINLHQICQQILDLYKGLIPDFNTFLSNSISASDVNALHATYNL